MARRSPRQKDKSPKAMVQRMLRNPGKDALMRTTIVGSGSLNSAVAATGATITYSYLTGLADFVTLQGLYREFRVVGIEFTIFDQNPANPISSMVGTIHTTGGTPATTLAEIQDLPDTEPIGPYREYKFYWKANTISEKTWLAMSSSLDYGGLEFYSFGGSTVNNKWRYLARYVVEFKGRL